MIEDELLAVAELIGDASSATPASRKQDLLDGLVHLLGADCWTYSHYQHEIGLGSLMLINSSFGGDQSLAEALEPVWLCCPYLKHLPAGKDLTSLRSGIVDDAEWSNDRCLADKTRDEPWCVAYKAVGLGDFIVSRKQVSPGIVAELAVHRRSRRPTFQDRHILLVRAINTRVHWLHKRSSGKAKSDGDPSTMPARQRQILQELLAGESPKGIARNLGLTSSTVRTYIKHLYRRLSVNTRGELLSKYISHAPAEKSRTKDPGRRG